MSDGNRELSSRPSSSMPGRVNKNPLLCMKCGRGSGKEDSEVYGCVYVHLRKSGKVYEAEVMVVREIHD